MALSLVVAVILAAIAFAVWRPQSPGVESLERRVHDFTCLSFGGRMDLAADYVVAGQDGRLKVWAALVGATSPGASTRSAQVRVYAASSHERLSHVSVRIEVQKGAQYKSMHTQRWIRSREGIWRFDPQATLRSIVAGEK
jgi:hypothetical protein